MKNYAVIQIGIYISKVRRAITFPLNLVALNFRFRKHMSS